MTENSSLKEFKDKNSSIEHADGCPAFFEMTMIGFTNRLFNTKLPAYQIGISHFENDEVDYISLKPDQEKIGQAVIENYMRNPKNILFLHKEWEKQLDIAQNKYLKSFNLDLKKLSDKEFLKESQELHDLYAKKVSMPGFIDGFMFYAENRFKELINDFCKKNSIVDPVMVSSVLLAPIDSSFLNEEENEIFKIDKRKLNLKNISGNKKIQNHLLKYSWIKSSYAGYREYSVENILEEIKRLNLFKRRVSESLVNNQKTKKDLIKKFKFSHEIVAIAELSDILIKWQDERKQYTLMFVTLKEKLLRELARRNSISFDILKYSLSSEIKDVLQDKINLETLKDRKEGSLFVYQKGRLAELITGEKVKSFMNKVNIVQKQNITEIKGSIASMGKVSGIVKVVTSVKYIDKVKEGDILVAPMTRPEYLAGMRKAAAVITDDGGITCHAAIISRELKIPCVIGTKVATKALRDGDFVEVDANIGVIKILNNSGGKNG